MNHLDLIQNKHLEFLELTEQDDLLTDEALIAKVQNFIQTIQEAGTVIENPKDRNYLRTILRFWASFIYDQTGAMPNKKIYPAKPDLGVRTYKKQRVFEYLFWGESNESEWQGAGKIPIHYFKTGDKVDIRDIEWLIGQMREERQYGHFVFIVFQDDLTEKAELRLKEFNQQQTVIIIPVDINSIIQSVQKPGLSYRKLVELKRLWSNFENIPKTIVEPQKVFIKTGGELAKMARHQS